VDADRATVGIVALSADGYSYLYLGYSTRSIAMATSSLRLLKRKAQDFTRWKLAPYTRYLDEWSEEDCSSQNGKKRKQDQTAGSTK